MVLDKSELKKFIDASYKKKREVSNIDGYVLDNELSTRRNKVYYNPETKKVKHVIAGTDNSKDWLNNLLIPLGLHKYTNRYKKSEATHKKTNEKYGKENVDLITHSQSGNIAENLAKKDLVGGENTSLNPAIIGKHNKKMKVLKSKFDPVSLFTRTNKDDVLINPKTFNPITEHLQGILGDGFKYIKKSKDNMNMEKTNKNGVCFVCINGEWLIRPCPAKNGKGITKSLFTAGKYIAAKATPVLKEIAKKALQEAKEKAIEMAKEEAVKRMKKFTHDDDSDDETKNPIRNKIIKKIKKYARNDDDDDDSDEEERRHKPKRKVHKKKYYDSDEGEDSDSDDNRKPIKKKIKEYKNIYNNVKENYNEFKNMNNKNKNDMLSSQPRGQGVESTREERDKKRKDREEAEAKTNKETEESEYKSMENLRNEQLDIIDRFTRKMVDAPDLITNPFKSYKENVTNNVVDEFKDVAKAKVINYKNPNPVVVPHTQTYKGVTDNEFTVAIKKRVAEIFNAFRKKENEDLKEQHLEKEEAEQKTQQEKQKILDQEQQVKVAKEKAESNQLAKEQDPAQNRVRDQFVNDASSYERSSQARFGRNIIGKGRGAFGWVGDVIDKIRQPVAMAARALNDATGNQFDDVVDLIDAPDYSAFEKKLLKVAIKRGLPALASLTGPGSAIAASMLADEFLDNTEIGGYGLGKGTIDSNLPAKDLAILEKLKKEISDRKSSSGTGVGKGKSKTAYAQILATIKEAKSLQNKAGEGVGRGKNKPSYQHYDEKESIKKSKEFKDALGKTGKGWAEDFEKNEKIKKKFRDQATAELNRRKIEKAGGELVKGVNGGVDMYNGVPNVSKPPTNYMKSIIEKAKHSNDIQKYGSKGPPKAGGELVKGVKPSRKGRFVKGSQAAKDHMAMIRAKKG
jgi:hypothetical protein